MTTIGFIGCSSRDKTFLMMYLGKILSMNRSVCLVTEDQWMTPALKTFELNSNFSITGLKPEEDEVGYCLLDVTEKASVILNYSFFVSGIERSSVEQNKRIFEAFGLLEEKTYVFLNLIMDSKINEKYLCNKFALVIRQVEVLSQYSNDNDVSVMIENGYNEELDLKSMSKLYKKLLMTLLDKVADVPIKEQKRWMRLAERSK